MPTYSDGWSNWEDQLNRKTDRHRKAAARKHRKAHRTALIIEAALFLIAVAFMVLDTYGIIPAVVAIPLSVLAIITMSFCAGIVFGAKNN